MRLLLFSVGTILVFLSVVSVIYTVNFARDFIINNVWTQTCMLVVYIVGLILMMISSLFD